MLKLSYTKSGVGLLKIGFLACPTKMDGPKQIASTNLLNSFSSMMDHFVRDVSSLPAFCRG